MPYCRCTQHLSFLLQGYIKTVQESGRKLDVTSSQHKIAIDFLHLVIEGFVVPNDRACIQEFLKLATVNPKTDLHQIGIEQEQILVNIAGLQIALLDLEEAVFRADLFTTNVQHMALREMVSRDVTVARKAPSTAMTLKTVDPPTKPTVIKMPPPPPPKGAVSAPKKKSSAPCMNGAQCRYILTDCRFYHSPEDIAKAGATVEELIGISTCKVGWIIGTNGTNITQMAQQSGADMWVEDAERNNVRLLHVMGNREAVEKGVELVMESAAKCGGGMVVSRVSKNDTATVLPTTASKTSVPASPPAKLNDEEAWPSLGSPDKALVTACPRVAAKPAIQLAKKDAVTKTTPMSTVKRPAIKVTPTAPNYFKNSKTITNRPATKVNAKKKGMHACIHGAKCRYIQTGRDECMYYHSAKELERAAANNVEHKMYISRAVVGWVIGKNGARMKEMIHKSGADIWIDQESMGPNENRIIYITGRHQDVDAAIQMVKEVLPDGQDIESGPGVSLDSAPTTKKSPNNVNNAMKIAPAVVGWVIGLKGSRLKSMIAESGAEMWIDQESMGPTENRILHISGSQEAVDAAIQLVRDLLPDGFGGGESDPGATSSGTSTTSDSLKATTSDSLKTTTGDSLKATAVARPVTPTLFAPSQDPVFQQSANLISPHQPIRQPQIQPATLLSNNTSESSEATTLFFTASSDSSPAAIPFGQNEVSTVTTLATGQVSPELDASVTNYHAPDPSFLHHHHQQQQNMGEILSTYPLSYVSNSPAPQQQVMASPNKPVAPTTKVPTSVTQTFSDTLLVFLKEQGSCLKGSPAAFHSWLASENINSLGDLAEAVADDDYLRDVLQQGDGTVGVKGFKRNAFKKAVELASQTVSSTNNKETDVNTTNNEPPAELVCPISHVLMTNDPVIAADGHTYERGAIDTWFRKQSAEIVAARQQIASGYGSLQARAIIDRGVLSPMTHSKMAHLGLTSNHSMRTMARDASSLSH